MKGEGEEREKEREGKEKEDGEAKLRIWKQPQNQMVRRIIKPAPMVKLETEGEKEGSEKYFVETCLVRGDTDEDISGYLEGERVRRIEDGIVAFKTLKITNTFNHLVRLKFVLKKYPSFFLNLLSY
jgi:hypothetical protein